MDGVPHYLVDHLDPREEFNVVRFQTLAKAALKDILSRDHIPIVVGGTGFYIQALLYDIDFSRHEEEEKYRKELYDLLSEKGKEFLYEQLKKTDPEYARGVHSNNVKRVIRALEYHHETGNKLSAHNEDQREKTSPYRFAYFVLNRDRSVLYQRIDRRVDQMMEAGLAGEVADLRAYGCSRDMTSMQGIGYKEFFDYFDGRFSLEDTAERIKKDTRHFAKRQLTWFRREKDVCWINRTEGTEDEAVLETMLNILEEKGIISRRVNL